VAHLPVDFLAEYDEASVLAELRRLAKAGGAEHVTKAQIDRSGRVSYTFIVKRFGSLRRALELAGLRPTRFMKASDDELLTVLVELWQQVLEKEGRTPQRKDLKAYGYTLSGDTILRRFGSWKKALVKASESVNETAVAEETAPPAESAPPRHRKPISLRKRFFVMKRDHFACVRCGASGVGVRLEIGHRVAVAHGGSDDLDNLLTLCFDCNRGQRDDYA
jgi:hypothetical protein